MLQALLLTTILLSPVSLEVRRLINTTVKVVSVRNVLTDTLWHYQILCAVHCFTYFSCGPDNEDSIHVICDILMYVIELYSRRDTPNSTHIWT